MKVRSAGPADRSGIVDAAHPHDPKHYYLNRLGTHTDHRGSGIGMGLLAENLVHVDAQLPGPAATGFRAAAPPLTAQLRRHNGVASILGCPLFGLSSFRFSRMRRRWFSAKLTWTRHARAGLCCGSRRSGWMGPVVPGVQP